MSSRAEIWHLKLISTSVSVAYHLLVASSFALFSNIFAAKYVTKLTTLVKATSLGVTVPYDLPSDVKDVCSNLMHEAYCPLYDTEDVTYLFVFPIGNYPEVSVKVEIYLVDQDNEVATCFVCSIKVKKAPSANSTVYEIDF